MTPTLTLKVRDSPSANENASWPHTRDLLDPRDLRVEDAQREFGEFEKRALRLHIQH
jgi:hypothetical protein